ncbi:glycosyltransferase family 87 protein [Pyxidicoccus sp. 3LFB2]
MTAPRRISVRTGLLLLVPLLIFTFAVRAFAYNAKTVDLDFSVYWVSARQAFTQQTAPYDVAALRQVSREWLPGRQPMTPFIYTPPALLPFWLFKDLEFPRATRLMLLINLLAVAAALAFMAHALGLGESRRVFRYSAVYILLFAPLYESLGMGQVNPVMLLLLCAVWHVYRSGRAAWAGGFAGAAVVFLKLHFGLLLLPLLLRRQWRPVLWGTAFLGLGAGLAWAVFPFDAWGEWYAHVVSVSSTTRLPAGMPPITHWSNLSVPGLTSRFLLTNPFFPNDPVPLWPASAVASVLCSAIICVAAWVLWRSSHMARTPERANMELCLVLATAFEVSPVSWGPHLVFLLPVMLLLGRHVVLTPGVPSPQRALLGTVIFLLAMHPIVLKLQDPVAVLAVATLRSLATLWVWSAMTLLVLRLSPAGEPDVKAAVPAISG